MVTTKTNPRPAIHPVHPDERWLEAQLPAEDQLDVLKSRSRVIVDLFDRLLKSPVANAPTLPHTVGLFGGWGSGKTATLAQVYKDLKDRKDLFIMYFNAYKYAGFGEVVPALLYKLIKSVPIDDSGKEQISNILGGLISRNKADLGKLLKPFLNGVDPFEIYEIFNKYLTQYKDASEAATHARKELFERYYTFADKAQDSLQNVFTGEHKKPIVVLVDELDRCDPGEAFEVMKELRILFGMRSIPFFFVLAANPEPIGQAIQHQFGLKKNDFESRRILEKFVDSYFDLGESLRLKTFLETRWAAQMIPQTVHVDGIARNKILHQCSTIIEWDAYSAYAQGDKPRGMLWSMRTGNFLYSNLRILEKSITMACAQALANQREKYAWVMWHLILLKQLDEELRERVAVLTHELKVATEYSYLETIRQMHRNGGFERSNDGWIASVKYQMRAHDSAFRCFYGAFWDSMKSQSSTLINGVTKNPADLRASQECNALINNIPDMDVVINMCAISLRANKDQTVIIKEPTADKLTQAVGEHVQGNLPRRLLITLLRFSD